MENRLKALQHHGQSVWLDYIRRSLITSGELERLIDDDGLRGVTSNPAIFEKAMTGSGDYHDMLAGPDARAFDAKGCTNASPCATSRTPPICCCRFTGKRCGAMGT